MKLLRNGFNLIKYLLQGFGLMLLVGTGLILFVSIFGSGANSLYNSELFGLFILLFPIGYAAVRLLGDNAGAIAAASWRRRFDGDAQAAAIADLVREHRPSAIEFLYDYPPEEEPAPAPREMRNPMYATPSAPTGIPVFQPQMRFVDKTGKTRAFQWPWSDARASMYYFPWWLEHQLGPGTWSIGEALEESGGGPTGSYTMQDNNHGGVSVYADYYDPVVYRFGWYMRRK